MDSLVLFIRAALRAAVPACAVLFLADLSTAASKSPANASDAPKTHVLFMGADLALEKDRTRHPITDVAGEFLVIRPEGKAVKVPLQHSANLFINESLKVAESSVEISRMKSERAYSRDADPMQQLAATAAMAGGQGAMVDLANRDLMTADMLASLAGGAVAAADTPQSAAEAGRSLASAQEVLASAQDAFNRALATPNLEVYNVGAQSVRATSDMFDAIRLSFEVTSDKPLEQPYYAVIAQIRDPGSKPGQARKWAYVQSLGAMSAGAPKRVSVYQSGFSPGYILENCEVHLYNGSDELATNLSRKRVPLTDDEALQYRIIEHIGANKGRTLPASLVKATLARETMARLEPALLERTYYVRVAKDGAVSGAFRDSDAKKPVENASLEAALKVLRFMPALEAGKPVESVVPLKLGGLPAI